MEGKRTFQQKASNFWYYYRHTLIVVLFFAVLLGFLVKDLFFRDQYDLKVVVATWGVNLTIEQEDALRANLEAYVPDLNGDGVSSVELSSIGLVDPESAMADPDAVTGMQTRLAGELSDYSTVLLIFDESLSDAFVLDEACVDLKERYGDVEGIEEYSIPLEHTSLLKGEALAEFPQGMSFYLRKNYYGEGKEKKREYYERQVEVFENILYDRPVR